VNQANAAGCCAPPIIPIGKAVLPTGLRRLFNKSSSPSINACSATEVCFDACQKRTLWIRTTCDCAAQGLCTSSCTIQGGPNTKADDDDDDADEEAQHAQLGESTTKFRDVYGTVCRSCVLCNCLNTPQSNSFGGSLVPAINCIKNQSSHCRRRSNSISDGLSIDAREDSIKGASIS
jgi:hypothetical protein